MKQPQSMRALEELGRVRLSENFFMRDFLYSEIANFYRIQNIPDDPDLAIMAGRKLCEEALEPLGRALRPHLDPLRLSQPRGKSVWEPARSQLRE